MLFSLSGAFTSIEYSQGGKGADIIFRFRFLVFFGADVPLGLSTLTLVVHYNCKGLSSLQGVSYLDTMPILSLNGGTMHTLSPKRGMIPTLNPNLGKGSFINDVHQKMGILDPLPPLVTKFSFKKISFVWRYHKISDPPLPPKLWTSYMNDP